MGLPTRSFDKETSFNESNSCSLMLKKPKLETKNDNIDASVSALSNHDDIDENCKLKEMGDESVFQFKCQHCSIVFPNQTLYFLHRGFHSEGSNPWRCNGCGRCCTDMYDFNTHLMRLLQMTKTRFLLDCYLILILFELNKENVIHM